MNVDCNRVSGGIFVLIDPSEPRCVISCETSVVFSSRGKSGRKRREKLKNRSRKTRDERPANLYPRLPRNGSSGNYFNRMRVVNAINVIRLSWEIRFRGCIHHGTDRANRQRVFHPSRFFPECNDAPAHFNEVYFFSKRNCELFLSFRINPRVKSRRCVHRCINIPRDISYLFEKKRITHAGRCT